MTSLESGRGRKKVTTPEAMIDCAISLISEGHEVTVDAVAGRAGVSRRTAYRYFPNRNALIENISQRLLTELSPSGTYVKTLFGMIEALEERYARLDAAPSAAIVALSTVLGRDQRLATKDDVQKHFRHISAPAVYGLSEEEQLIVMALFHALQSPPWLTMHDYWGLKAPQMTRGIKWVIRLMLADLGEGPNSRLVTNTG